MSDIHKVKEILKLPSKRDQLEYMGPVNNALADSFLTMGHSFLYQFFTEIGNKRLKAIFSSLVEMVQNVAEYNESEYKDNYPQSYLSLKGENKIVLIDSINCIKEKDLLSVTTIFENIYKLDEKELDDEFKKGLLNNGSLGLLMLRRLPDSTLEYQFNKDETGINWLCLELRVNYGNI